MRLRVCFVWVAAVAAMIAAAPCGAAEWTVLGELTVDLHTDRDVITVAPSTGPLDKIKLQVRRNGIEVLANLHAQTGLDFTHEQRPIRTVALSRAGG
jgi:hypothetical protein